MGPRHLPSSGLERKREHPEFSGIYGTVVKSTGLKSPDLTFVMVLPLNRWVALGTGQPRLG